MRPRVSINSYLGAQQIVSFNARDDMSKPDDPNAYPIWNRQQGQSIARSAGVTIEQPVFDGFKALNSTNAPETPLSLLNNKDQASRAEVFFDTASSYMNVSRAILPRSISQENNVAVLTEQLRQTNERFSAGQITLTDIRPSKVAPCSRSSASR